MKKQSYRDLKQRLDEIQQALKTENNVRLYQRYQVIHLHLQGQTNRKIAKMVNLTEITVGTYLKKYRAQGIEGLFLRHSPGAPRRLTQKQEEQVREIVLNHSPAEAGLKTTMNWTSPLVREWIQREFRAQ